VPLAPARVSKRADAAEGRRARLGAKLAAATRAHAAAHPDDPLGSLTVPVMGPLALELKAAAERGSVDPDGFASLLRWMLPVIETRHQAVATASARR
jgi:hypothetical protein